MHDTSDFLANLAMVLGVAALTTVLFHKLRQPVVLGYLLAGLIIGPHIPIPLVADEATVHTLSELGVILLMFSLGLEFSLTKLFRVAPTAGAIALVQCSLMVWLGYLAGIALGWTSMESLYTGAIVAISSTTIIVKAFAEQQVRGAASELVFGVLIVEDLVGILLLAILTAVSSGAGLSAGELGWTVFRLGGFLVGLLAIGMLLVPRLFRFIVRLDRPEMTVVASIGFCFVVALVAQRFGYSVALGAFIAGALIAESGVGTTVEHLVAPVRDIFAAVFFVAVGMLIDPQLIAENALAVGVLTALVIVGMITSVSLGAFITGFGVRTSIETGMSMAQIGEFSFIIAGVGVALGSTRNFLYPVAVAVSAITTLTTPWLIRSSPALAAYVDRRLPKRVQTFMALYGSWLEKLRSSMHGQSAWHKIRSLVIWLIVDAVCLGALVIGAATSDEWLADWIRQQSGHEGWIATLGVIAAGVLCSLPFCVGIVRSAKAIGVLLATQALPRVKQGELDPAAAPRRAFVFALQFGVLLLVAAPWVAVTQPFLPSTAAAALLFVGVLATLGIGFWRTAADLQGHVQAGSRMIAEILANEANSAVAGPDDSLAVIEKVLPGLGSPVAVQLDKASPAIGRTLVQINLRGKTGATVLAIARGAEGFLPTGKESLLEGDVLALSGTHEAIAAARDVLVGWPRLR